MLIDVQNMVLSWCIDLDYLSSWNNVEITLNPTQLIGHFIKMRGSEFFHTVYYLIISCMFISSMWLNLLLHGGVLLAILEIKELSEKDAISIQQNDAIFAKHFILTWSPRKLWCCWDRTAIILSSWAWVRKLRGHKWIHCWIARKL